MRNYFSYVEIKYIIRRLARIIIGVLYELISVGCLPRKYELYAVRVRRARFFAYAAAGKNRAGRLIQYYIVIGRGGEIFDFFYIRPVYLIIVRRNYKAEYVLYGIQLLIFKIGANRNHLRIVWLHLIDAAYAADVCHSYYIS